MYDSLLLVVLAGILATIADYYLKIWANTNDTKLIVGAIIIYAISIFVFALSLKTGTLLTSGAAYVIVNALGFLFLSKVVFGENITQTQYFGVIIGMVALYLIEA